MRTLIILFNILIFSLQVQSQNVALNFDGNNDHIQTSYSGITGTSSRTVEFRIRTTECTDNLFGLTKRDIISWGSGSTNGAGFSIYMHSYNGIEINVNGLVMNGKKGLCDGNWHHVAVVYDSAASFKFRILVDGVLDSAFTGTSINTGNTYTLKIGSSYLANDYFKGDLDEIRIFDTARTDSSINADKNKEYCIVPKNLKVYYKLNEGIPLTDNSAITTVLNFAGNGNNGTLTNFILRTTYSTYIYGSTLIGGNTKFTIKAFDCRSYTSPDGKSVWTSSGSYKDTISNFKGCDSIITINLKIGNSLTNTNVQACDSFVIPGQGTYFTSGQYTDTFSSYAGCDSVVQYNVTMHHSKWKFINAGACDSFVSGSGKVYYNNGVYNEKFSTFEGCDSILSYKVTIYGLNSTFESITACDSIVVRGKKYFNTQSPYFKFTGFKGCDSFHTVFITIKRSKNQTISVSSCDSFISGSGIVYRNSGTYTEKFPAANGCDSNIIYKVKINNSYKNKDTISVCRGLKIKNIFYDQSGIYKIPFQSHSGCDSTVDIKLIVTILDTGISKKGNTLTSKQTGATYEWISCDNMQPIPGETGISFTTNFDGNYAVILNKSGCTDTSFCYDFHANGIHEISSQDIAIFPNPNNGKFQIRISTSVPVISLKIVDIAGRTIIFSSMTENDLIHINENLDPGVYYVALLTESGLIYKTFLVN